MKNDNINMKTRTIKQKILSITAYCGVFPYDKLETYYGEENRKTYFKVVSELINDKVIAKVEIDIDTKSPDTKVTISTKKIKELLKSNTDEIRDYLTELYNKAISKNITRKSLVKLILKSTKKTKEYLTTLYPDAYADYASSHANALRADVTTNLRLYRTSEVMMILELAGVNILPYSKPGLHNKEKIKTSCAYKSVEVKLLSGNSKAKTSTQFHAMMFNTEHSYTIYNMGEYLMEWDSSRQYKASEMQKRISYDLTGSENTTIDAIIISPNFKHAEHISKGVMESQNNNKNKKTKDYISADGTFENFHFVPANINGVAQIQIMNTPNYLTYFFSEMFPDIKMTVLSCDADILTKRDDKDIYILYGYDLNLSRIGRLALYASKNEGTYEVLCFSWQKPIIESISKRLIANCNIPDADVLDFYGIDTEYIKGIKRKDRIKTTLTEGE